MSETVRSADSSAAVEATESIAETVECMIHITAEDELEDAHGQKTATGKLHQKQYKIAVKEIVSYGEPEEECLNEKSRKRSQSS
jgi:hypothetical protein